MNVLSWHGYITHSNCFSSFSRKTYRVENKTKMKILVVIFLIPFFISNGIFEIIEIGEADKSCDLLSEEIARMKGTIHILCRHNLGLF